MTLFRTAVFTGILAFLPLTFASAWSNYGSTNDSFFFPYGTGPGAPREELIVYAWGPGVTAQSPFNTYNQPSYQPAYQPMYQPAYQPVYQTNYYQPQTYYQPSYNYYQPSYTYYEPAYYPQQYAYAPSYSYAPQSQYYYAEPTGSQDFWGNDLCNWGNDYQGYPCSRDPHQWIHDPYTGEWY
jgi:hypothetical protein